jgi:hypothetical protein
MKHEINITGSPLEAAEKVKALEKIATLNAPVLKFLAGLDVTKANSKLSNPLVQMALKHELNK